MSFSLILFITTALFGFHLLKHVLAGAITPKGSLLFHSLFAAAGLAIVIVQVYQGEKGHLVTSLVFLVLAAIGGFIMGYIDVIQKKHPPKALAIVHPILALTGVVFLVLHTFGNN